MIVPLAIALALGYTYLRRVHGLVWHQNAESRRRRRVVATKV